MTDGRPAEGLTEIALPEHLEQGLRHLCSLRPGERLTFRMVECVIEAAVIVVAEQVRAEQDELACLEAEALVWGLSTRLRGWLPPPGLA